MATLKREIIDLLKKKTDFKEGTIRSNISKLRADYPSCTINAVAQLYARSKGYSVMQKLSKEDKASLPHNEVVKNKIKIDEKKPRLRKRHIIEYVNYETNDYFKKGHINELNKAYTYGCFTAVYALARKIIENLVREILARKYPPNSKGNKELYFDINRNRFHDFSVILKNLYDKRDNFGLEKSHVIRRLYQKTKSFKVDSNDKVHSWYHLVRNKTEIDDIDIQSILELIKKLEE